LKILTEWGKLTMDKTYPSLKEVQEVDQKLTELRMEHWIHHDLFSPQWWFLLLLLIAAWATWWKFVDRKRLVEILLYGLVALTIINYLDDIGFEMQFWEYDYQLFKIIPRINVIDFTVMIAHMLIYQYYIKWRAFMVAQTVMAFVFSFVAEPILVWMGIYIMHHWKYIYSFPIYILMAILLKWTMEKIKETQREA
jgi:hypothetical protein